MNRMKAPSYIMKYRELRLKVPERKMNTSLDDEGTIADNEGMKGIILTFFYKRLLISELTSSRSSRRNLIRGKLSWDTIKGLNTSL